MKAVLLCGGSGKRLSPLTLVTNKLLLPVYDKPMVYYPIKTLINSGIKDIFLVTGGFAAGEFLRVLGNGEAFGLKRLHYAYQKEPKGVADALSLAEEWADREPICLMLGDNIFEKDLRLPIEEFEKNPIGAKIFTTEVQHPEAYGVVETDLNGNVISLEEKPKIPKSNLIAAGIYLYDSTVWDIIKTLIPSQRGELEITDVNNHYLSIGKLKSDPLVGWWGDAGEDFDALLLASNKVKELQI